MSDRQGFLDAIRLDPESDAPRLVYADWLDENGDPGRAAFIRYQVAAGDWIPEGVRLGAIRRFRLGPPGKAAGRNVGHLGPMRRGFLGSAKLESAAALADLPRLLAAEPLTRLEAGEFWRGPEPGRIDGLPEALSRAPALSLVVGRTLRLRVGASPPSMRCRRLDLAFRGGDHLGGLFFPDATTVAVQDAESGQLGGLFERLGPGVETLQFDAGFHMEGNPADLLRLPWPEGVTHLDAGPWGLGPTRALAESGRLPALRSVDLELDRRSGDGLASWPAGVRVRRLEMTTFGGRAAAPTALDRVSPGVEDLVVKSAGSPPDPEAFAPARWPNLRRLELEPYGSTAGMAKLLGRLAASVEELYLRWGTPPGLFAGPAWKTPGRLRRLYLARTDDAELRRIAELPGLAGLEVLDVGEQPSPITPAAVNALARSAFGPNLRALNLGFVGGLKAVAEAALRKFGPRCNLEWSAP